MQKIALERLIGYLVVLVERQSSVSQDLSPDEDGGASTFTVPVCGLFRRPL